jgi:hypothetical protein
MANHTGRAFPANVSRLPSGLKSLYRFFAWLTRDAIMQVAGSGSFGITNVDPGTIQASRPVRLLGELRARQRVSKRPLSPHCKRRRLTVPQLEWPALTQLWPHCSSACVRWRMVIDLRGVGRYPIRRLIFDGKTGPMADSGGSSGCLARQAPRGSE